MNNQITFLKNTWKAGAVSMVALAMAFGGLVFVLSDVEATGKHWKPKPSPSPSPQPSPSPVPSPIPSPEPQGGQEQNQEQGQGQEQEQEVNVTVEQKQENNQTVNVTVPEAEVAGTTAVPVKQPETGVGVLGMASMAGAGPLGLLLARYGRGRVVGKREEENLSKIGFDLTENRKGENSA